MSAMIRGILIVMAATGAAVLADPPKGTSGRYDFLGVVESIDTSARTIVVRHGRKPKYERTTIRYDANTEIIREKKQAEPDDVEVDARIWVYLREDQAGKKTDLARRLTISDPYPDIYGVVESVDATANKLVISRNYPGGSAKDRRQTLVVRVNRDTKIIVEGRAATLKDVPVGRRVTVTSVRAAGNRTTDLAAKVSVWREAKKKEKSKANGP